MFAKKSFKNSLKKIRFNEIYYLECFYICVHFGKIAVGVERVDETMGEIPTLGNTFAMRCTHE